MSRRVKDFFVAYLFLVGLPLAGLAVILQYGRQLTAPMSVNGVWTVEADLDRFAQLLCMRPAENGSRISMVISQSGNNVVFHLAGSPQAVNGTIEGGMVRAFSATAKQANDGGCKNAASVVLAARVEHKSEPRTLVGSLSVLGCASCIPVTFVASREALLVKGD